MERKAVSFVLNRGYFYWLVTATGVFTIFLLHTLLGFAWSVAAETVTTGLVISGCAFLSAVGAYRARPVRLHVHHQGVGFTLASRTRTFAWTNAVTVSLRKELLGYRLRIQIPGEKKPLDVSFYRRRELNRLRDAVAVFAPAGSPFRVAFA